MSASRSPWSLELCLVIGIPLATVVAGVVTVIIASSSGFSATEHRVDRFGQPIEVEVEP